MFQYKNCPQYKGKKRRMKRWRPSIWEMFDSWKQTFWAAAQRIRNLTWVIYYKALHRKNNHASTDKRKKKAFLLGSNEPLTWLTASPAVISSGGFPSIWCSDGNNLSVWELTFSNLGWLLSLGSTKCSISARVNSLHKKKVEANHDDDEYYTFFYIITGLIDKMTY